LNVRPVASNAGIWPRTKPEYSRFRQVSITLGFALRKPKTWAMCFESAAQIGNGPKSPGRAGGGPSPPGFQADLGAAHRPFSDHSESRPGLSAGGSNRFSRRLESGAFGTEGRTGTRFGNRRTPGFRRPNTHRIGPRFAPPARVRAHSARRTPGSARRCKAPCGVPQGSKIRIRASGRSATHSGLTRRCSGTRREVQPFSSAPCAGSAELGR
jgi:hypothetical protein